MKGHLVVTFLITLVVMGVVVAGLAVGLLITGKPRLKKGCGLAPKKGEQRKNQQSSRCSLCGNQKECEEKNEPPS